MTVFDDIMMVEVKRDVWPSFTYVNQKCKNVLTWFVYAKDRPKLLLNDKKEHEFLRGFFYVTCTHKYKTMLFESIPSWLSIFITNERFIYQTFSKQIFIPEDSADVSSLSYLINSAIEIIHNTSCVTWKLRENEQEYIRIFNGEE